MLAFISFVINFQTEQTDTLLMFCYVYVCLYGVCERNYRWTLTYDHLFSNHLILQWCLKMGFTTQT